MSWLKKFGEIALKCLQIAIGFAPLVQATVPAGAQGTVAVVASDLSLIAQIIAEVETMGQALQLPGAQKLTAATPLVAQIILQSAVMANHKIADEAKFKAACAGIASNVADLLNSLEDKVVTIDKT